MSSLETTLLQWAEAQLNSHETIVLRKSLALTPLSGDAGFRQYFLLDTEPSLLAVCAPKTEGLSENAAYFARLANSFRQLGIHTPQIIACDDQLNFMLIEDFGSQSFLDVLDNENVDTLYGQALMILLRMQQAIKSDVELPVYNDVLLHQEMDLFGEWFVEDLLAYQLSESEKSLLNQTYEFLVTQALSQPQVLVHRDFHSRNLIFRESEAPGVIDFQDAVWGPLTYDIVSLLKDCYIEWPKERVKRWLLSYAALAAESNKLHSISETQWLQWFDTMGMQRHLKVLGIFARLSLRDNKHQYLEDLPLVWRYTLDAAKQYPETQAFYQWCNDTLLPLVKQQKWFHGRAQRGYCA